MNKPNGKLKSGKHETQALHTTIKLCLGGTEKNKKKNN